MNLHFSVLPAWRGAAPVQHALLAGDEVTGATTFRIVRELDAGPTYGLMTERVRPGDTAGDLLARLAEGGAGLLVATLDGIEDGSWRPAAQPEDGVSFAPKITVEDAHVDWTEPAMAVDRRIRACTPAPGAWTTYEGERVKLGPVTPADGALPPGELLVGKNAVAVGTGTGALKLGAGQGVRQEGDAGRRLGPRGPGRAGRAVRCPASVTRVGAMAALAEGASRGRRRDLRRAARDRARHLVGRPADLEGAARDRRARGSCSTATPRRRRSTPRRGAVRRPDRDHDPDRGREERAGRRRRDAVLHDPALQRLQRRARAAVAARRARRQELEEIITDAWATKAPKRLVKEHLG